MAKLEVKASFFWNILFDKHSPHLTFILIKTFQYGIRALPEHADWC